MDLANLNEWMQVVGIFAVVLSLMFVGLHYIEYYLRTYRPSFQAAIEQVTGDTGE